MSQSNAAALHHRLNRWTGAAVLATGLMLLAFLSMGCGLILDSVARGRREAKRIAYLAAGSERAR